MDATFVWKLAKLGRLGSSRLRYDDDFVDRLNYQVTGVMLFLFIGIIGIRQYVGKPIQCWSPQEFTRGWEEYAENYCWVSNTYYAPLQKRLPHKLYRDERMISYYQWAWIFMGVQALLFYLPCLAWRGLYPQSRFNVRRVMQMAGAATEVLLPLSTGGGSTDKTGAGGGTVRFIAKYIDSCIRRRHAGMSRTKKLNNTATNNNNNNNNKNNNNPSTLLKSTAITMTSSMNEPISSITNYTASGLLCAGHRAGNCLAMIYLLVKLLFLANTIFQIYIMKVFIGTQYMLYGLYILYDLIKGNHWTESGNFPRVTFCDFEAKKLGKNHLYTLQCVLPINMILEKVFIILWFWVSILAVGNLFSLITWTIRLLQPRFRVAFVRRHLHVMGSLASHDRPLSRAFSEQYLGADGILLLRLVGSNCCEFVAGQLAYELWTLFKHRRHMELEEMKCGGGSSTLPGAPAVSLSPVSSAQHHPHHHHHYSHQQQQQQQQPHKGSSKINYANSNRCVAPLPSGINHDDIV